MRLTWKDGVATVLVGAIGAVYGFYLAWGGISLIEDSAGNTSIGILDPTGMSALALVLGVIAAAVGGWIATGEGDIALYGTVGLAIVSAALGVASLVGENLFNNTTVWESVLGAFMASIGVLWAVAIGRHAGVFGGAGAPRAGATPA